jgi:hypothetical protein
MLVTVAKNEGDIGLEFTASLVLNRGAIEPDIG